jgi:glucose/arabinose dehydrogenase
MVDMHPTRPLGVLGALSLVAATLTAGVASASIAPSSVHVQFHQVASGFSNAVAVTTARDGSHRLFVVQQSGVVRAVTGGQVQSGNYLNIASEVRFSGEQGLLSIAFHPHFSKHPFVFAAYVRGDGALQVSRFKAKSASATHVSAGTERHVLRVPHSQAENHNGGQLLFTAGGLLLISTGDGGGGGDQFGHAEDLGSLSGKILRINIDRTCGSRNYCIPHRNPFARSATKQKAIFDWGLRNPWRMSIDRSDGHLWFGDVGQDAWEEIDHVLAKGGKDFGWSCREGRTSYNSDKCAIGGRPRHMTAPVHVYHHDNGRCVVIGGFAYHGPKYPFAHGLYFYADYCSGELFALGRTSTGGYRNAKVGDVGSTYSITGFGESGAGELYAVTESGTLYHLSIART